MSLAKSFAAVVRKVAVDGPPRSANVWFLSSRLRECALLRIAMPCLILT